MKEAAAMKLFALAVLCLVAAWPPLASAQTNKPSAAGAWVDAGPAVVTLKGFLVKKQYYGAPNYGETPEKDQKVDGWLLFLSPPINIRAGDGNNGDEDVGVRRVQLDERGKETQATQAMRKRFQELLGHEVYVTGTLWTPNTGWYWVGNVLEVTAISPVPRSGDRDD